MEDDPYVPAFWDALADTPAALEQARIEEGDAWTVSALAGLQYHAYHGDDGLDGIVRPRAGDRLHLVREPTNPYDENAVRVYWRNEHQLGHLSSHLAEDVSAALDRGESLRAYIFDEGDGGPWSCKALLVGEPVRCRLARWTTGIVNEAVRDCWGKERQHHSAYAIPGGSWWSSRYIINREITVPPTVRQQEAAEAWDARMHMARLSREADAVYALAQLPQDAPNLPEGASVPPDPALRGTTFGWWDQVPPGLMTKTTMLKYGLRPQGPAFAAISYSSRRQWRRYDLHAVSEAVPCMSGSVLRRAAAASSAVLRRAYHG